MSESEKYYYLRLKENFFESHELSDLESMPDGFLYSNILLKMYLKSLRDEGRLMLGQIPYDAKMIAKITKQKVKVVKKALVLFQEVGLIEVLDNGAIYMLDIQNFIGQSTTEADRKRSYRERVHKDVEKSPDKCPDISPKKLDKYADKCPDTPNYKYCTIPKISKIAQNALPAFEQPVSIPTQLDFQRFSEIAATVYPKGCQYTLEQCLEVFRCYFQTYEDYRGHPHSPLRPAQITRIMEEMPCIVMEDRGGHLEPLAPEDYVDLIDLHFRTPYQNCDYNINHFFSGRIREILLYDAERDFE